MNIKKLNRIHLETIGEIMRSLVTDLENDITNNKDILSILNKALIISNELCLEDFKNWIECEINGYDSTENMPNYRFIECQILYDLPTRKKINLVTHPKVKDILGDIPKEYYDSLVKVAIDAPISNIIHFIGKKQDYYVSLKNKTCENIIKEYTPNLIRVYQQCFLYKIESIIDRIKPEILRWCAELKKNNIYGHDERFTNEEINAAKTINYNFLIINNSHIQFKNEYYNINNQNTLKNYIFDNLKNIETIISENKIDTTVKININNNIEIINAELNKKELNLSILEKAMFKIKDLIEEIAITEIANLLLPYITQILSLIFAHHTILLQNLPH